MEEKQTNDPAIAAWIRFIGILCMIGGIILIALAQLKEITISAETLDAETLIKLPQEIAEKANNTIIGGFLIVVGIQLCLVSTKLITEIKAQF